MGKEQENAPLNDENALIRKSRDGDADAFGELMRRYRRRVLSLCFQIIGDQELAEDVTQETFIRAFQGMHHFQMQARFYTWLYRIAVNLSINALRKRARQRNVPLATLPNGNLNVHAGEAPPLEELELQEIHEIIEVGLKQLPHAQQEVMRLFDLEGHTYQEIAQQLHLSIGTVRSRLHYARKRMRHFLQSHL